MFTASAFAQVLLVGFLEGITFVMPKKGPKRIDADLGGFCNLLDKSENIRGFALEHGKILSWPTPAQNGVMSFDNLAGNHEVIKLLIDHWASQFDKPIMVPVDAIKDEVGYIETKPHVLKDHV